MASNGERTPPCGVPSLTRSRVPFSMTGALRNRRISHRIFRSAIRSCDSFHQYPVVDVVEAPFDVSLDDPFVLAAAVPVSVHGQYALQRASLRSEAVGIGQEVGLEDWLENHLQDHLHHPILHRRNAYWSLLPVGLRNVLPEHRRGAVGLAVSAPSAVPRRIWL